MAEVKTKRRELSMPAGLRRESTQFVSSIARRYGKQFKSDPELKNRVLRLVRALLPPHPKPRGRPGDPTVSMALKMYGRLRRKSPEESGRAIWLRVYPVVIPGYVAMTEPEQRTAREQLQLRVGWRRRKRRKILAEITV